MKTTIKQKTQKNRWKEYVKNRNMWRNNLPLEVIKYQHFYADYDSNIVKINKHQNDHKPNNG